MDSLSTQTEATTSVSSMVGRRPSARTTALSASALGITSSVAYTLITVGMTLSNETSRDLTFHHTGDYWYTAIGVPLAISSIVLLFAVRGLQPTARPKLTSAGVLLNASALTVLIVMLATSVVTGAEARWGGTYIVATLATFVAHILFSAGSWRVGLIPRPMLTAWPLVWLLGSFAAQGASPLILAAFYGSLGMLIARRT